MLLSIQDQEALKDQSLLEFPNTKVTDLKINLTKVLKQSQYL